MHIEYTVGYVLPYNTIKLQLLVVFSIYKIYINSTKSSGILQTLFKFSWSQKMYFSKALEAHTYRSSVNPVAVVLI